MPNVKQIRIVGELPFNCAEHPDMQPFLAQLNAPSTGLRITYGKQRWVPNAEVELYLPGEYNLSHPPENGKTAMYEFTIHGQEAVSYNWVRELLYAIVDCGGKIRESIAEEMQ